MFNGVRFVTYGTGHYWPVAQQLASEANATGWFASAVAYGRSVLPLAFAQKYAAVLARPRGAGYWIWKVALLRHALRAMSPGDFLVYADAGCELNVHGAVRFTRYLELLSASVFDIISFQLEHEEHKFTTARVFGHFNISRDDAHIRNSKQYSATALIMRHGPHLHRCLQALEGALEADPWLFTDAYSVDARAADPAFVSARHDQSLFSVVRKLLGSVVLADETWPPEQRAYPLWASRRRSAAAPRRTLNGTRGFTTGKMKHETR